MNDKHHIAHFNMAMARETENTILNESVIMAGVENLFRQPQYGFYLVAEQGNEIIGCLLITYEWSDWRNGLYWWIQSVYILPEWRRQGVFRQMYQTIKDLAQKTKCAGIRLYVHENNPQAIQTYLAMGMTRSHYNLYELIF